MAKILIVDDDAKTRFLLRRFVHDLGHVVIEASNGRRAWDVLWDNRDIDLVITDLLMPELTGEGLMQMIRASLELKKLPILVLSGPADPDELRYLVELGATGFVSKPVSSAIKALIQRVLLPGQLPEALELRA